MTGASLRYAMIIIAIFGLGGCGGEDLEQLLAPEDQLGKADHTEGEPFTFVTYNAGLAHGAVALAEERLPLIIDALQQTQADVLCLQEVWTDEDAQAVTSALSTTYPRAFRYKTEDTTPKKVKCGLWSVYQLDRCVKKNCSSKGISAEECVQTACKERYDDLSDECKLCLAANTAAPTWCAFWGAREYANQGRNGLLLLSRHPIENPSYTPFDTLLVKRGMISATVAGRTVHCTHLSADLDSVPYPEGKRFSSWAEEQAEQVTLIAQHTPSGQCAVVLGDLNMGLQTSTLSPELPDNFSFFSSNGFDEPWPTQQCTWCIDNPLAGSKKNVQLDHVLFSGCPAAERQYTRVLDQPIELEVDGAPQQTRLSDHYGLRVDVAPTRQ